jgi:hypothetical protein
MVPDRQGGRTPIRQIRIHDWREAMAQAGASYYCIICLSTQLVIWLDGEVSERTLMYSDPAYDPDAEEQVAPSGLVVPA